MKSVTKRTLSQNLMGSINLINTFQCRGSSKIFLYFNCTFCRKSIYTVTHFDNISAHS